MRALLQSLETLPVVYVREVSIFGIELEAAVNAFVLARELGICRRALYNWRDRLDQTNPPPARSREMILRKQILRLKRLLANKTLEVDFFRRALQRVGARRHQKANSGDTASTMR